VTVSSKKELLHQRFFPNYWHILLQSRTVVYIKDSGWDLLAPFKGASEGPNAVREIMVILQLVDMLLIPVEGIEPDEGDAVLQDVNQAKVQGCAKNEGG